MLREGLPCWLKGKESTCQCRRCRFDPWVRKIPWRRKWQLTLLLFLPGKAHGQRNLVGYSSRDHRVRHMTWWLNNSMLLEDQGGARKWLKLIYSRIWGSVSLFYTDHIVYHHKTSCVFKASIYLLTILVSWYTHFGFIALFWQVDAFRGDAAEPQICFLSLLGLV